MDLLGILPLVGIVLVFWLLILRPARKRQKDVATLQSQLAVGERVMLTSGIFGELVRVGDTSVEVRIAADTVIEVHRQAVGEVVRPEIASPDAVPPVDPTYDDDTRPQA